MKTSLGHLTYCTNIHTGENWKDHFHELKKHVPEIKSAIAPDISMGIGLRISRQMQVDLGDEHRLKEFQSWLDHHDLYIFTINGFPYGDFHSSVIKEKVHQPDWTTTDRLEYTLRLFDLLQKLLPDHLDNGGISTSPLSYRHWHNSPEDLQKAVKTATHHILQVAEYLHDIHQQTGQQLHLDIEPEPDGLIEDGAEFIQWYEEVLLPMAHQYFSNKDPGNITIESLIRNHIQLCYDVCHMAVEYEDQPKLVSRLRKRQIPIGKIQLSSALKILPGESPEGLKAFVEDQYLHQVVIKPEKGELLKYKDLNEALQSDYPDKAEWRVHFHVPLFTRPYHNMHSTQDYITEILDMHKDEPLTHHLEIETYTWEVLPPDLQLPLSQSIIREYQFILKNIK